LAGIAIAIATAFWSELAPLVYIFGGLALLCALTWLPDMGIPVGNLANAPNRESAFPHPSEHVFFVPDPVRDSWDLDCQIDPASMASGWQYRHCFTTGYSGRHGP